jgi:hypothetical protein
MGLCGDTTLDGQLDYWTLDGNCCWSITSSPSLLSVPHSVSLGHLYYFLVDVLPVSYGYDLLHTPEFCISFVEWGTGFTHPANVTAVPSSGRRIGEEPAAGGAAGGVFPRGGYNWGGSGRVLGTGN